MRKRLKRKRRTCTLCKGHKRGHWTRWTNRDLTRLQEYEQVRHELEGKDVRDFEG